MATAVLIGGVGASISVDDIVTIALGGASVTLDTAGLDRIKKDSPNPKSFTAEDYQPQVAALSQTLVDGVDGRAAVVFRLLTLINGRTRVRPTVIKFLASVLNNGIVPSFPCVSSDVELSKCIANICYGEGTVPANVATVSLYDLIEKKSLDLPKLSSLERKVLESGQSGSTGIACLCVKSGKIQAAVATAVAALSCEALRADVKSLEQDGSTPARTVGEVLSQVCGLLEGSMQVNPKKGAVQLDAVLNVPQFHAAVEESVAAVATAVRGELMSVVTVNDKGDVSSCTSPAVPSALLRLCQALLPVMSLSIQRTAALLTAMEAQVARSTSFPQAASLLPELKSEVDSLRDDLASCRQQTAEVSTKMALEEVTPNVRVALTARQLLQKSHRCTVVEALAAAVSLRLQQGPEGEDGPSTAGSAGVDKKGEDKKKSKKGGGVVFKLGKGTSILRTYVEEAVLASGGQQAEDVAAAGQDMLSTKVLTGAVALSGGLAALSSELDAHQKSLKVLMVQLTACIEANQGRRKPKIPKGARDLLPDQMTIREIAFNKITSVFKRHGAVSIDTPVFELKETLTGKYGEDSKLIYDLADQGGELLSLRYDLTVPFARYVALHNPGNIKRFHIGKVYRRDSPKMSKGRFREFYQCDFDIAGAYPVMVADAECLKVLVEILSDLPLGEFEVKLNHRKLLDAMLDVAGVPTSKFRPICSAIDKLDKEPWIKVKAEMVVDKGLAEEVADRIAKYVVLRDDPPKLLEKLRGPGFEELAESPHGKVALDELDLLCGYLSTFGVLSSIKLDLSLARGLDYYTGAIYEAVLTHGEVGSIAAGGRYDQLVGMFSGKDIPAVGVSIGIERVFNIMENNMRQQAQENNGFIRETETQVLVASFGNGLQRKRMEICSKLWSAGIKAEFGYKPNPKFTADTIPYAKSAGIPLLVLLGEDELARGELKIKDMHAESERVVAAEDIVEEVRKSLKEVEDGPVVCWGDRQQVA